MRTKTLLLTAAVFAAGLAASMAQVYSVNSVGYVNFAISRSGFALVANPLNGTNNQINTILSGVPVDTQLYRFVNGSYADAESFTGTPAQGGIGWVDGGGNPSTTVLNPGEGFFLYVPSATTVTFVGEVPQGKLTNAIPNHFSIRASQVPQSSDVNTLGFPGVVDDTLYFWDIANQTFKGAIVNVGGGQWFDDFGNPVNPTPTVAEAFFVDKQGASNWTRNFDVNN